MSATPKALRTRNMKTAEKALTLIRDAADMHLKILGEGRVPESSFTAPVAKYETALTALRTLEALGEDGPPQDDAVEDQAREDLRVLVRLVGAQFGPDALQADSPLGRVARVAFPDGLPAADQQQDDQPGHGYWEKGDD